MLGGPGRGLQPSGDAQSPPGRLVITVDVCNFRRGIPPSCMYIYVEIYVRGKASLLAQVSGRLVGLGNSLGGAGPSCATPSPLSSAASPSDWQIGMSDRQGRPWDQFAEGPCP